MEENEVGGGEIFIFNGTEVTTTGRVAARNKAEEDDERKKRRRRSAPREDLIYEITPADSEEGSWKKWVRITDLYRIVD